MSDGLATSTTAPRVTFGYRHVIVFIVWLLYVVNFLDRMSVLTFLPYIQKDLNLTPVEVGWLGSIFFFGYALAQFSSGFLSDKIGAKKTMNIAIWVFTLVTFLTGFVRSFWQFMILRLGLALGEGHHWSPALRMIANWSPRDEKNRAYGFFATSWAIAPAITPLLVTWVSATFFGGAWKPIFFLMAIPGFVGVWLLARYVSDSPKEMLDKGRLKREEYDLIVASVGEEADIHGKTYSTKMFTTDPMFYMYIVGWFIMLMIFWGMNTWITTFLVKQHNLDLKTMGLFASLPYVVAIIANYLGGWLADKVFKNHPKIVTMIGFLGCVPVLYWMGQVPKGATASLLIALALGGLFINLGWGMMSAYPSLRYPKELVGRSQGIANGIGQFGAFVSPLIAGYLVVTLPDKSYDFGNVFLFWSMAAVIGAIVVGCFNEKPVDHASFEMK